MIAVARFLGLGEDKPGVLSVDRRPQVILQERTNACNNQFLFSYNVPMTEFHLAAVRIYLFDRQDRLSLRH